MSQPDLDVATFLGGAGLDLTLGENLFWGKEREVNPESGIPSRAVFVVNRLSVSPTNYIDEARNPQAREPLLQVVIRSEPQEFTTGYMWARDIKDALHDADLPGYDACRVTQAEPIAIGESDSGEHLFSLNVHLWIDE